MKRAVAFVFLVTCCGALLGSPNPGDLTRKPAALLEDLVRMTRAGAPDMTVLAYAQAHRREVPPELGPRDLRWLRDSGVSETVVSYMTAIDLRAPNEDAPADVASGPYENTVEPRAAYSYPESADAGDTGSYPVSYDDASSGPGDDYGYGYGYYPSFGYWAYPYPVYFFANRCSPAHRSNGGNHHGSNGPRPRPHVAAQVNTRGAAWRDRGASPRQSATLARSRSSSPGRIVHARAYGSSGGRTSAVARSGISHPSFSGGSHAGGGAHSSHAATGHSGGRGK